MSQQPVEPFDPGVVSGGYSTNLLNASGYGAPDQEPMIFVGFKPVEHGSSQDIRTGPGGQGAGYDVPVDNTGHKPIYLTQTALLSAFDKFSRSDFLHFRNLLIAAGLAPEHADPATVRSVYAGLLSDIADMNASGVRVSPMGYVKNLIRMNGLDASKIGSSENFSLSDKAAAQPWTKTQKSVYDLSPEDARTTLEEAMTAKLGRAPTAAEVQDFINAAQTAAQKNPTVATATFTPGKTGLKGDSSTSTTENGVTTQQDSTGTTVIKQEDGFSAEDVSRMAANEAKTAPDYAGYQAVATYFPALMSMLGATAGG